MTAVAETKDRLERVGRLVACLLNRVGPVSRADLEKAIPDYVGESGRRRFEDDKAALRRGGVLLRVEEQHGVVSGCELRREDYELPRLDLTDDERLALHLAVGSVDFSTVPWAQLLGTKLGADAAAPIATLAELPGLDLLPGLLDAVTQRQPIGFVYRGEDRAVDPWGVVLKHGRWYLPGFDHLRDDVRVFRVDRIEPNSLVRRDGGPFEVPDGVVPRDLVPDDALVIDAGERRTARIRADRRIAGLLSPAGDITEIAEIAEGSDEVFVEVFVDVEVSYPAAFVSWLLGFGELVVVEDPPELRALVIARLRELAS